MLTKYVLPILAVLGLAFAVRTLVSRPVEVPSTPLQQPPPQPDDTVIAGAGIVEARAENIPIGTNEPGVVSEVLVRVGQAVKAGTPLFRLDDRPARAELAVKEALRATARAELERLKAAPRAEDIPPAEAEVDEARAIHQDLETRYSRALRLRQQGAYTDSEFDRDRYAFDGARSTLRKAEARLARIRSGSWSEDLRVAEADLARADAEVQAAQVRLDRQTIRALVDGEVLQVNVRPGQFAALAWNEPLIVLGDLSRLHVRVDIDENDLPLFDQSLVGEATLKGNTKDRFPLTFERVEPYVIPKRSLTGENAERVDTRVLQVLYALPAVLPKPVYVGQQMDVFLKRSTPADDPRERSWSETPPPVGVR